MIRKVEVIDVLAARDARVELQNAFLEKYRVPLVSFTMNIPGSIKYDAAIDRAFRLGVQRILLRLERLNAVILDTHEKIAFTGCEQLWAVDADAETLKREMTRIEDMDELGRLFDIDVLDANGVKLSRDSRGLERACLICGGPVRACARSRAHSADELFARAHQLIEGYFLKADASCIAMLAQQALLTEAIVTPKPGLVDRENSGAHTDMDLFTFADSACVLRDYFEACARIGLTAEDTEPSVLFEKLRYHGLNAEEQMLRMTHGVNTHKGALFSLGILCCAAGMPGDIFENAAPIAKTSLTDFEKLSSDTASTAGEKQYLSMKLTGARGEAASGFPTVRNIALPALEKGLESGMSLNDAALSALIALMAHVDDSNVIKRGGPSARDTVKDAAQTLTSPDHESLRGLNDTFTRLNLSPGGCADLLACALFVRGIRLGALPL
ncbi:MAG: citrate lyase holo-[Clostridia bacterium]|nr:citrate lyase holo-[acyl-carrier protein] synthase [Clostridia bacterium]